MRSFIYVLVLILSSGNLPGAFAQETTIHSGFAVVTLVSGNIAGLIATETLTNQTISSIDQAIVAPSTLITSASMLVRLGPVAENTTAIAVANPSQSPGGMNLILTDGQGGVVLNTTINIGPLGQFSKYLNEFFTSEVTGFTTPLLLTVSSEIPLAILALNFRGGSFTAIPMTSLSTPTPVPIQPLTPLPPNASLPGFGLGLPPESTSTFCSPTSVFCGTGSTSSTVPSSTFSTTPPTTSFGGTSALVFPQVAAGGGWSTELTVGNTSSGLQSIRVDFFNANGILTGSLSDILIQPRGVFFFSSDAAGAAIQ